MHAKTHPQEPADEDQPDLLADAAASLDDYLAGSSDSVDSFSPGQPVTSPHDPEEMAETLDIILRLRQVAAADGGNVRLPAPHAPGSIGRYELVAIAGHGGFAVVWEAVDPLLRRRVAVKVRQLDALLSPTLRRRFLREAEIASRLVHPHIVTIHEVAEEHGREYIVEEFCAGGSLAAWLAKHPDPLPPRTAARIVQTLARAAAYAHAQGVIHRDIKPANVLLTESAHVADAILPDRQTVKLADFGLGTLAEESHDLSQLTVSGSRLGTPAWMAPEQIDRSFGTVGPTTDIHALGLLLHRLLSGRSPHAGRTDAEIYRSVLLEELVAADRLIRSVPPDLAAVCAVCLAKRPADRYPTATALATDLERFLAGKPTAARPLSPAARLGRAMARRRLVAGLTLGLVVALVSLGWSAWASRTAGWAAAAQRAEIREKTAASELQRAFAAWRAGSVSRALEHATEVRGLSPALADSLAGRWLGQRLHGEKRMLFTPPLAAVPVAAHAIAVSPDGRAVAAGFADGTLRLIDVSWRHVSEIMGAHDEINDVCFSPDGQTLATAGQDGLCRWWRITDAGNIAAAGTMATGDPLYGVTFLADGLHLAMGGEDRVLTVIDTADRDSRRSISLPIDAEYPAEIEAVTLVSGGTVAVSCGDHVFLVDATGTTPTRELEHRRPHQQPPVFHSLAISPDGMLAAAGGSGRRVLVWTREDGRLVRLLPEHPAWVNGCDFSPTGRLLATGCRDGMIRIFRVDIETPGRTLQGHVGRVWDVTFHASGSLISAGGDGSVREWDPDRGPETNGVELFRLEGASLDFVTVLPGGPNEPNRLVVSGNQRPPSMLRREKHDLPWRCVDSGFPIDKTNPPNGFTVDPQGRRYVMSFSRKPFAVGEIGTDRFEPATDLPVADPSAGRGTWTPQGRLVTAASESDVTLWSPDLRTPTTIASLDWHVTTAAAAPAGRPRVAVAGQNLIILSLPIESSGHSRGASDEPLAIPITDSIARVAWSPDGRWLLCGSRSGETTVVDTETGSRVGALVPHAREIVAVAWSPDGKVLLTADDVGMRMSDATTLVVFDEIRPGWTITDIAVAPSGDLVAIAGKDPSDHPTRSGRLATLTTPCRSEH